MSEIIPTSQSIDSKSWRGMTLPSFLIQQLASTAGAMLFGTITGAIPAVLISAVTKNTSGGNWADHIADQPILRAVGEPYFALPVLAGFFLGVLSSRFFRSSSAAWVWVLPTIILVFKRCALCVPSPLGGPSC
jgi:hypothetical protein